MQMRHRRRAQKKNSGGKKLFQALLVIGIGLAAISLLIPAGGVAAANAAYQTIVADLPDPSKITKVSEDFQTTKLFDRNGKLLYEIIDPTAGDRQWVKINDIADNLKCATVSIEDKTFYENAGFDLRGTARAFINNLTGGAQQGGSGITQQLVKNVVLPPEERAGPGRTNFVKFKEVLLSGEVSRKYEKTTVLEWYLNTNFYGNLAYGIQAASKVYFNKSAAELSLAESAMLAAIPQFPKQNPFDSPNDAKTRQALVLDLMVQGANLGIPGCKVTPQAAEDAKRETLKLANIAQRFNIVSPHFSVYARDYAIQLLADQLGLSEDAATEMVNRGGLKIYTTLDSSLNEEIRKIAANQVAQLAEANKKANNSAVVVLKPGTGEILAMVGSIDYYNDAIDGKFNVATALRQPGSSFKPITYLELIRQGGSPATTFWDVRTTFDSGGDQPYVPENYDRKYHGPVRMRVSLSNSYNIPAVKALEEAGIGNVIRTAHTLGITDLDRGLDFYGLALTLGGGEVKLLDMAYVYATIDNDATMIGVPRPKAIQKSGARSLDPSPINRIEDKAGKLVWEYKPASRPNLLGPKSAQYTWLLKSIMSDRAARQPGFGSALDLKNLRTAAVKTGTTNDNKDNWTMGFTNDYVVGVWVGNTDNTSMDSSVTGVTGAAPIWRQVMNMLHEGKPNQEFKRPDGLVQRAVCAIDGLLPNGVCPAISEWFVPGTEPKAQSTIVQKFPINKETGKIAVPGTPPDKVEEKVMYVFPPQAQDWINGWAADGFEVKTYPLAPNEFDTQYGGTTATADVAITEPQNGSFVSPDKINAEKGGNIEIRGNAKGGNWVAYKVFIGAGLNPAADKWQQIGPDKGNQVDNNVLENWNIAGFAPGPYTIKVQRVEGDGNVAEAFSRVTLDAKPPSIRIAQPFPGEHFTAPAEEWIDINTTVSDDFAIDRVEFFVNGAEKPFATKTAGPYSVKWTIPPGSNGGVTIKAVAYDRAGNKAESQSVGVTVAYKK